jgi:hypothetical protein
MCEKLFLVGAMKASRGVRFVFLGGFGVSLTKGEEENKRNLNAVEFLPPTYLYEVLLQIRT